MADAPSTWVLLQRVQACAERIRTSAGYLTDLGQLVVLEMEQEPEEGITTWLGVVLVDTGPAQDAAVRNTHQAMTFAVVPMVKRGAVGAQALLHQAISDVRRCLQDARRDFPVGTEFPKFAGVRPIPPAEGMAWIGAEVRFVSHVPNT